MSSPYQLPGDLRLQPLGVSWATLGDPRTLQPNAADNQASLLSVAWQASGMADTEANQALRATLCTEQVLAPSHRCGILPSGVARLTAMRNPVLRVVSAQVSPASVWGQPTWSQLPEGHFSPEEEPFGIYNDTAPAMAHGGSQGILLDGAYVNWGMGPKGIRLRVSYLAGWPHAGLTANAAAGATSLEVDDVTAWAGAAGWVSDAGSTETVFCSSVSASPAQAWVDTARYAPGQAVSLDGANFYCLVGNGPGSVPGPQSPVAGSTTTYWQANPEPAGPGTLELSAPLAFDHAAPVLVTTMPPNLRWAVALYAKAQALERGVATMGIGAGKGDGSGSLAGDIAAAKREAAIEILNFRRVY